MGTDFLVKNPKANVGRWCQNRLGAAGLQREKAAESGPVAYRKAHQIMGTSRERENWGCNSGVEHLPSMGEVLGLILQEKKKKKKYKRNFKTSDKKKNAYNEISK